MTSCFEKIKNGFVGYFGNIKRGFKPKYYINYVVITLFLIINTISQPKTSTTTLLANMGIAIILAVSLNLVVGFLGELSLGHAGFMCIGAYLGTFISNQIFNTIGSKVVVLILTMIIGGLVAAIFGYIVGFSALRLKGDYLAIVTLAFGEIVRNICNNIPIFGDGMGLKNPHRYGNNLYIVAFIMVLIMLILIQNLIRSKHGRAITAIRDNEIAARAMGINVTYYKLFVFVLSAFFAGVAGVLYGSFNSIIKYGDFSFNKSIEILVMVVLGGMGSINGSIIAAALITFINTFLQNKLPGDLSALRLLVYALILMVVVIFNNAPALSKYKDKYSLSALYKKIYAKITDKLYAKHPDKKQAIIKDDSASWSSIPTKIKMDEVLSTDINTSETLPGGNENDIDTEGKRDE